MDSLFTDMAVVFMRTYRGDKDEKSLLASGSERWV